MGTLWEALGCVADRRTLNGRRYDGLPSILMLALAAMLAGAWFRCEALDIITAEMDHPRVCYSLNPDSLMPLVV